MKFDKIANSDFFFGGGGGGGGRGWRGLSGGEGGGIDSKTVCQTVKRGKIQNSNHLHNVKACNIINISKCVNVFKYKPYNSNFGPL